MSADLFPPRPTRWVAERTLPGCSCGRPCGPPQSKRACCRQSPDRTSCSSLQVKRFYHRQSKSAQTLPVPTAALRQTESSFTETSLNPTSLHSSRPKVATEHGHRECSVVAYSQLPEAQADTLAFDSPQPKVTARHKRNSPTHYGHLSSASLSFAPPATPQFAPRELGILKTRTEDSNSTDLKRFARHGGPDLSDLRGVNSSPLHFLKPFLTRP